MNPDLNKLQSYPFEKLATLKQGITPNAQLEPIAWSIGEPKHEPPALVLKKLATSLTDVSRYPTTKGITELREAICGWLSRRFQLPLENLSAEQQVIPVNGTREALFAFAQSVVDRNDNPLVMLPNPFYQIYEGAALLAGAEPVYINCLEENQYQPDFSAITDEQWQRCQLLYLCSPNNPTGSTIDLDGYIKLIELAHRYDFIIASDECYSEIYTPGETPPASLLQACVAMGNDQYKHCVVFHSLSKRSNLPGLRSGFVAGDATVLQQFLSYRTYHGCAMPLPTQLASIAAWNDEAHVGENQQLYRDKFECVAATLEDIWPLQKPQAGFNFWAKTPIDDEKFTQRLFAETHITVLPGRYLSRTINGINPGENHVRMALVAPLEECETAALRIKDFFNAL